MEDRNDSAAYHERSTYEPIFGLAEASVRVHTLLIMKRSLAKKLAFPSMPHSKSRLVLRPSKWKRLQDK